MGNADAMSRRGNKSDYYITPWQCVQALIDKTDIPKDSIILDPCAGTGVIGKVLKRNGYCNILEEDIIEGNDFLQREEESVFDYIIANPPYSIKNAFIDKAIKIAHNVIMILPANVINYNEFQEKYLDIPNYMGRLLMRPKFFMEEEEREIPKLGGVSSYAWFWWFEQVPFTVDLDNISRESYIDLKPYFKKEG